MNTQWFPSDARPASLPAHAGPRVRGRQTLICFSHLRWDFVFQRPQHLMTRFARDRTVIYWEEPVGAPEGSPARLERQVCPDSGVIRVTPFLADGLDADQRDAALRSLAHEYGFRTGGNQRGPELWAQRGVNVPDVIVDVIDPPSQEWLERMIVAIEARFK